MKTWQAFLAHAGITALQALVAAPIIADPHNATGALANTGVQIAAQAGMLALQGLIAQKNSNTDPNGEPLNQIAPGVYKTAPAERSTP